MSYSFTQIEKDKSATIGFVFFFLVVFYVFLITGICVLFKCFWFSLAENAIVLKWNVFSAREWFIIILIGIVTACLHYFLSITGLTPRVLRWMRATDPDPAQSKHRIFLNILEEVSAATGGSKFQAVLIPQTSLNAFALDDENSIPVIGITEGALYRLNRAQLEAVVAHEAAHILQGDCSTATMVSAMFEIYTLPLRRWMNPQDSSGSEYSQEDEEPVRWGGGLFRNMFDIGPVILIFLAIMAIFYFVTSMIALTMRMFISREAKLRADATAVRLTRDPASLAQAIRLLADNWRGEGSQWEALEGVFFVNPVSSSLDEQEGFFSNMFSTHPPVQSRLSILLSMAHCSQEELEQSVIPQIKQAQQEKQSDPSFSGSTHRWLLQKDNQWLGPFTLLEVGMIDWLKPQTPTKVWGDDNVRLAQDDQDIKIIALNKATAQKGLCPVCKTILNGVVYEQQQLLTCPSCQGALVNEDQAGVIMARKDVSLSEEAFALARRVNEQTVDQNINWQKIDQAQHQSGFLCPHCLKHMQTRLFNAFYPVAIDKCLACGYMWFEAGELDLLQALRELRNPGTLD